MITCSTRDVSVTLRSKIFPWKSAASEKKINSYLLLWLREQVLFEKSRNRQSKTTLLSLKKYSTIVIINLVGNIYFSGLITYERVSLSAFILLLFKLSVMVTSWS